MSLKRQRKKRQQVSAKKLAALKNYADYLGKKIIHTHGIGAMSKCNEYVALLWQFLEDNPQLKKKYPALKRIINRIDDENLSSIDYYLRQKMNI